MERRNDSEERPGEITRCHTLPCLNSLMFQTGHKELLFNATNAKPTAPRSRPLSEQHERESQKLWYKTCVAIKEVNHNAATDEKTKIEDRQREEAAARQAEGREWLPRLFRPVHGGPGGSEEGEEGLDWILNANMYRIFFFLALVIKPLTRTIETAEHRKTRYSRFST